MTNSYQRTYFRECQQQWTYTCSKDLISPLMTSDPNRTHIWQSSVVRWFTMKEINTNWTSKTPSLTKYSHSMSSSQVHLALLFRLTTSTIFLGTTWLGKQRSTWMIGISVLTGKLLNINLLSKDNYTIRVQTSAKVLSAAGWRSTL